MLCKYMKEHYLCILNPIDLFTVYELYLTNARLITFGLEISETPVSHLVFVLIHSFLLKHVVGRLPDLTVNSYIDAYQTGFLL
jgi:hypothetical protein